MTREDEFEKLRPLLFSIAYRLLGCVGEAEDAEVAAAVGHSDPACRQLAVRARRHMQEGRPRFEVDRERRDELARRFFNAFAEGDVDRLRSLLAADIEMVSDSGGKPPQWGSGIFGAESVSRLLHALGEPLSRIGGVVEPREFNRQPGAIFRSPDGKVISTWTWTSLMVRSRRSVRC